MAGFEKTLNDKKDAGKIKLEKADDGKYYLIPGKYTIEIEDLSGHTVTVSLKVVEKKNGSGESNYPSMSEKEEE